MTSQVIVLLDLFRVGRRQAPADRPARHTVHHQPVVEERRPRLLHRVEHDLPVRVRDLPTRPGQQREQHPEPAEQHRTVGAGVRHGGVLDERPVRVEPVATRHIGEDGGEGIPRQRHLGGVRTDDPAQRQDPAQVDPVGPGAGPAVVGGRRVGHEVVNGGAVVVDPLRRQLVVHQHTDTVRIASRRPALPVSPVPCWQCRAPDRRTRDPATASRLSEPWRTATGSRYCPVRRAGS